VYDNFYRKMLCVAWTMPSQDVHLSVRPSATCWYNIKMAKHLYVLPQLLWNANRKLHTSFWMVPYHWV